jgi:hypothetical protein
VLFWYKSNSCPLQKIWEVEKCLKKQTNYPWFLPPRSHTVNTLAYFFFIYFYALESYSP